MPHRVKHVASKRPWIADSSASCPQPNFDRNFQSTTVQNCFEKEFAHRDVKPYRVVDFKFLKSLQFPYLDTFAHFIWMSYLPMNVEVYEKLIAREVVVEALNLDAQVLSEDASKHFEMILLAREESLKIKKGSQVDLAGLIFDDMMRIVKTPDSTLVYGMALSMIFRHLEVSTRCDIPITLQSITFLDALTVCSMGYIEQSKNVRVKKIARAPIDPDALAL
ncbi:hypothetical protein DITRI_Ditri06bG0093900 [Diplodiscus trichospermus]